MGIFKPSASRYRVIKGERFVNWLISPSDEQMAALRTAGIHYRMLDGDLFIPESETAKAEAAVPLQARD